MLTKYNNCFVSWLVGSSCEVLSLHSHAEVNLKLSQEHREEEMKIMFCSWAWLTATDMVSWVLYCMILVFKILLSNALRHFSKRSSPASTMLISCQAPVDRKWTKKDSIPPRGVFHLEMDFPLCRVTERSQFPVFSGK